MSTLEHQELLENLYEIFLEEGYTPKEAERLAYNFSERQAESFSNEQAYDECVAKWEAQQRWRKLVQKGDRS